MLWALVLRCWAADPRSRPDIEQVTSTLRTWREAYVASRLRQGGNAFPARALGGGAAAAATASGGGGPVGLHGAAAPAGAGPGAPGGGGGGGAQEHPTIVARGAQPAHASAGAPAGAQPHAGGPVFSAGVPDARHSTPAVALLRNAAPRALASMSMSLGSGQAGAGAQGFTGGGAAPGTTITQTHMSFEVLEPPIAPALTSTESDAMMDSAPSSSTRPRFVAAFGAPGSTSGAGGDLGSASHRRQRVARAPVVAGPLLAPTASAPVYRAGVSGRLPHPG
jgi:hypothetical protein